MSQTQTTAAAMFVTVIGTIGQEPTTRTLSDGKPVANAVLYDNRRPEGDRAYSLAAFGSAVPLLQDMHVGDLVMIRARLTERPWERDGKSGVERFLTLAAKGTKVLSRKGENHKQAA
jgi:single-stranded DNA-binding protein